MIEVPHKSGDVLVLLNHSSIALKVDHVYWIKSYEGHEQPEIHISECIANQVLVTFENLLNFVKGREKGIKSLFVSLLTLSKSCLIDTIVNVVVDPFIHLIDLTSKCLGEKI